MIGVVELILVMVNMFGMGCVLDVVIMKFVCEYFDLCLKGIIKMFDLLCLIYEKMVVYGYFGCEELEFLWEVIDKVFVLVEVVGVELMVCVV